jgi:hypothetical protein
MQVWDVSDHLVNESVNSNCSTHLFTLCERKVTVTSEIHQPSCTYVLLTTYPYLFSWVRQCVPVVAG